MMVDIGGGTSDLVVHGFRQDNGITSIVELVEGMGGVCAGGMVDDEFFKYFAREVVPGWPAFAAKNPAVAHNLRGKWFEIKRGFSGASASLLPLKVKNQELLVAVNKARFPAAFDDEQIDLPKADVKAVFDFVIKRIFRLMQLQFERLAEDPSNHARTVHIFLVGGLSESPYVLSELERLVHSHADTFGGEHRVRVFQGMNPGSAICQGAVVFGLNPGIFSARRARHTFGCKVVRRATQRDPEERCRMVGNNEYVDAFHKLVLKNELLESGATVSQEFAAEARGEPYLLSIPLYVTDEANPKYPDEPGVRHFGTLEIAVPANLQSGAVVVELAFSGTVISATGYPKGHPSDTKPVKLDLLHSDV